MTTRRVDTVSEQYDRFSSLHATQLLIDHHVDGVVQPCAVSSPRALNGAIEFCTISAEVAQDLDVVVERDDHHAVVRTKLIDEADRRVLNVFESKLSRGTRVEHQHDRERFID